jgi:hypothetical protein
MSLTRVVPRTILQAELDQIAAEEQAEIEQAEAIETLRDRQVTLARLTLALVTVIWPRLTTEERQQVRDALPLEDEQVIKSALQRINI